MEVPTGFGPMIIELQSIALPTWLRNHSCSVVYYSTAIYHLSSIKNYFLFCSSFRVASVFVEGWGDGSFVQIGNDAAASVPGAVTYGNLAAVILQDCESDGYELSLIDTDSMTERWRKKLPEELFAGVYTDIYIEFTED